MKRKDVLELARIVKKYNDDSEENSITFEKPYKTGRGKYVVCLSTTQMFTSVFLERISGFIHFDEYNIYISHYGSQIYLRIS